MTRKLNAQLPQLLVDHFAESGLDKQAILQLKIRYHERGSKNALGLKAPSAEIPYMDLDGKPTGFSRFRLLENWIPEGEDKPRKYMQAANSGNHLYLADVLASTWRAVAANHDIPLVVTEGEKKAALACLNGFATIGLGGVWNFLENKKPLPAFNDFVWIHRSVYICFDSPDLQKNAQVAAAADRLAVLLRSMGADVKFVVLPHSEGKKIGLDDFLVKHGPGPFSELMKKAVDYFDEISEVNFSWAVVQKGATTLILKEIHEREALTKFELAKPAEATHWFDNRRYVPIGAVETKPVPLWRSWMKSSRRRQFSGIGFEPGFVDPAFYNTWNGFAYRPKAGDCALFLEHVRENICNGSAESSEYVLNWAAHMVQHPRELPGTALVLMGGQGVGKTKFAEILGALLGEHYLELSRQDHLIGQFNGQLEHKLLVLVDEAIWAGDKAGEGPLKAMITSRTRLTERKGVNATEANNYIRVIVASNNAWPVPAGVDERRMVVLAVGNGRKRDLDFFGALQKQMEIGGYAALLHFLLTRDISKFRPQEIPKTDALLELKQKNWAPIYRFWYACLERGANISSNRDWELNVDSDSLYNAYQTHAQEVGEQRRLSKAEFGSQIKTLVPGFSSSRPRRSDGVGQRLVYHVAPLNECREHMESLLGQKIEWSSEEPPLADSANKERTHQSGASRESRANLNTLNKYGEKELKSKAGIQATPPARATRK